MYKDIQTFATKYKHTPTLQTGTTPQGDKIYRCNGCATIAFVTKNNDVYGYGTKTICSRPMLSIVPHTMTGINVEVIEHPESTILYNLPNVGDIPILMAQLASTAASNNHKMEPLDPHPAFAHLLEDRVDGMRCSVCKAPITGGIHRATTSDNEPTSYAIFVMAWKLSELCRGYYIDKDGNKVYPTPTFPAKYECTLSLTGEVLDLCYEHTTELGTHILKRVPTNEGRECVQCVANQRNSALVQ